MNIDDGADYSEPLGHYPMVECPKCHKEQVDMDGFGFIACIPGCGYCKHVSAYKADDGHWYCGLCTERLTART
jgi:hypothetical protein